MYSKGRQQLWKAGRLNANFIKYCYSLDTGNRQQGTDNREQTTGKEKLDKKEEKMLNFDI
ncbi:MAG: hypothetical protein F6K07_31040 [Okeania sp. SIO1H5]|nr:hypothetical protein [Okeania sp. SIO1H5]